MIMLTQVLAVELGHLNVQVNAIAPGIIKTGFSQVLWQTPQIADPVLKSLPSEWDVCDGYLTHSPREGLVIILIRPGKLNDQLCWMRNPRSLLAI